MRDAASGAVTALDFRETAPAAAGWPSSSYAIGDGDSLLASGIVDSLGVLDVVYFIEEEFCITLSDDAMLSENFETIAAIADFVAGQLKPDYVANLEG